ncbi:hypothetical protein MMC32_002753 [Xylographa parallela]|nr:hypothetical protein [Xylographa parallela]
MTNAEVPKNVAIIGAGLSGLGLAIALHNVSIPCIVYELRPKSFNLGGGVMLSPNALRVLDDLGVYPRIRDKGFNFETLEFTNEAGEKTDTYYFGSEKFYGYQALRIYRQVLIDELLLMLEERDIPVKYETKFSHVISESDIVEFAFADGSTGKASMLIGADGIHSTVRKYLFPDLAPKFSSFVAITSAIPRSNLRAPHDYHMPVTIMAKPGAFVMAPQDVDGSEIMVGMQRIFPERDRAGWDAMLAGQQELLDILRKDLTSWPDIIQSALQSIVAGQITIWPFYGVPKLDKWASTGERRVIILGDAAHAIPPTTGQGVNQAFEDIYMLAQLLAKLSPKITLSDALLFWQTFRQERIDKVLDLTQKINAKRLPPSEQAKLAAGSIWKGEDLENEGGQLRWLYEPELKKHVIAWTEEIGRA